MSEVRNILPISKIENNVSNFPPTLFCPGWECASIIVVPEFVLWPVSLAIDWIYPRSFIRIHSHNHDSKATEAERTCFCMDKFMARKG